MSAISAIPTADFLRAIWPTEGHYCIALKLPKGMHHQWFTSIDDAAAFAVQASARGVEVYHACASFQKRDTRKANNVHRIKALWLDIDVGKGKPYIDDRTALAALLTFCTNVGYPIPTLVHSGGGWHAYWLLAEAVSVEEWLPQARALKALCAQHGLATDPSRTADAASILRPVGTNNFKLGSARPVALRHTSSAYLQNIPTPTVATPAVDNSKFLVKTQVNDEPASAELASQHCKQLANFKSAQGAIPEPEWYAGLCVLAHCTDGEALAHQWSSGDERYVYGDTARKLEHARRDSGPTTCDKFQSINREPCIGCPHYGKIKSPIQLGRSATPAAQLPSGLMAAPADGIEFCGVHVPKPPEPFSMTPSGALQYKHNVPDDNGNMVEQVETIYKCPIFVDSMREHEVTGQTSLLVRHYLPNEGWLEAVLPWHDHSMKVVLNSLGAAKINVYGDGAKYMNLFLHKSIDAFQQKRKTEMEYAHFGWRNNFSEFLLGNELYSGKAVRAVGVSGELLARARMMKPYGTFEGWRSAAQPLFVHPQQGMLVVAGFASVLMKFVAELSGVIIAAVSPEPRLGKTMGLVAARTIWGDDNAIDIATNDTSNSRFKMLSVLNGIPATWDDMRKSNDPEVIKQFVLSFSQGRDKNRLDRGGNLRSNISGWSSLLLATSNISIAELVGHDGETAQQARILEYRFKKIEGIKFSDGMEYERTLRANRGTAGRRFIQGLMQPGVIEWCRSAVPACVAEYEKQLASQQASFYASALGCLKAACLLLNKLGTLEFSTDRVMKFAVECAQGMTAIVSENRDDHVSVLTRFINEHWAHALIVNDAFKPKQTVVPRHEPRLALGMRYEIEPGKVYIERMLVRAWCRKNNIMFNDLENELKQRQVLLNTVRRLNLGAGTTFSGGGQTSVWEVDVQHEALGGIRVVGEKKAGTETASVAYRR